MLGGYSKIPAFPGLVSALGGPSLQTDDRQQSNCKDTAQIRAGRFSLLTGKPTHNLRWILEPTMKGKEQRRRLSQTIVCTKWVESLCSANRISLEAILSTVLDHLTAFLTTLLGQGYCASPRTEPHHCGSQICVFT